MYTYINTIHWVEIKLKSLNFNQVSKGWIDVCKLLSKLHAMQLPKPSQLYCTVQFPLYYRVNTVSTTETIIILHRSPCSIRDIDIKYFNQYLNESVDFELSHKLQLWPTYYFKTPNL